MIKILIATQNRNKQLEIASIFSGSTLTLVYPGDVPEITTLDVSETGATLEENALHKARAFATGSGITSLADDSGLFIEALDGRPGVASKRWFPGSDTDRNREILKKMQGVKNRAAEFRTVACLYNPVTKSKVFFNGTVSGIIAKNPKGSSGFGYDPIFIPEKKCGTMAELSLEEKQALSHRGRAFQQVRTYLENL